MKVIATAIKDVVIIEPQVFGDARGWFLESWQRERYAEDDSRLNRCIADYAMGYALRNADCHAKNCCNKSPAA